MKIKLQKTEDELNKMEKEITDILEIDGTLKNDTSVIDPVILVKYDGIISANYMTIEEFGRSYFINNISSIRNGLLEISGHVDVLTTYKEQIKQNTAIIQRQEKEWNLYVDDGSFKTYQNPIVYTKTFPNGFNRDPEFVLVVAGSKGAV